MIKGILKIKDALNSALLKIKKIQAPLSVEEVSILYEIEECLGSFEETTVRSGITYFDAYFNLKYF